MAFMYRFRFLTDDHACSAQYPCTINSSAVEEDKTDG